ncbi:MAG: copper resistance system multicopper oxidase [Steroidobacteraceae bacterium]
MNRSLIPCTRRRFVQGAASAVALGAMSASATRALAAAAPQTELTGTEFDLEITELPVNFTGQRSVATAVNGQVPAPVLRVREGDTITLRVTNRLDEMTSIHWHGLILPADMDGVPGISFPGIAPGATFAYRFTVRQSGTYWYHAHTLHEQTGLYGALIVEPREPQRRADRDYAVLLSDWTDEEPLQVYLNLKKMGSYYNFGLPTVQNLFSDLSRVGISGALARRSMWNGSRMNPTDYSDVSAATYTYLFNGASPAANWTGIAHAGERVRLRFIGAGTATYFDVRIPGLKLTVVSTDGQEVEPVEVDEFRIGPGETYDVIVRIPDERAYTIFAQSMDRTGYARGTLAPRVGMKAEVPSLDAPTWLTDADMMGAMASMTGSAASSGGHTLHGAGPRAQKSNHARTEYGPAVDMRVDYPRVNLDDPGINLRNNGRRVLTYADLRTTGGALDGRQPDRQIELHLTGNMERFQWSIDGLKLSEAKPIHFREGERLRVVLVNDTTMTHPMHLHGVWSELESPDGAFQVRKHTVSVQPAQRLSFAVTADAPGRWAFHCHLLYHMAAGMFREVVIA